MKNDDLRERTKAFALRVIKLYGWLPQNVEAQTLGKQILRSGTSVAHITARRSARSRTLTSSAKLMALCKSWTKLLTGSSFWKSPASSPPNDSNRFVQRPKS